MLLKHQMKWGLHVYLFININSKYIEDLNLKSDILQLLEVITVSTLQKRDEEILSRTPITQELKATMGKCAP